MLITDIARRVAIEIPELPNPVAELLVRESAREFCRKALAWREDITVTRTDATRGVTLTPDTTGAVICEIMQITDENGEIIVPMTRKQLDRDDPDWRDLAGTPGAYVRDGDYGILWNREPEDTLADAYDVTLALMPAIDSTEPSLTFSLGGVQTLLVGDTVQEDTGGETGVISTITLSSGGWGLENAAGTVTFSSVSAAWTGGISVDVLAPTPVTDIMTGGTYTAGSLSTSIPDEVTDRYIETLVSGALYRAFRMPLKPWSSTAQKNDHFALFQVGINEAAEDATDERKRGIARSVVYGGI
jgi:hypothetical protein